MRRLELTPLRKCLPLLPSYPPSNQCLTDTSLFLLFSLFLCYCFPLFSGMFCWLVGFLQDGIEDTEMFYILQMACDHNCTAEGSCWDLLIGCAVLRDHPTLSVGAACCWLCLNCVEVCRWIDVVPYCSPDVESLLALCE